MTANIFMMNTLLFFLCAFSSLSTMLFSVEVDEDKFYSMIEQKVCCIEEAQRILYTRIDDDDYYYLLGMTAGLFESVDAFDECIIQE